MAYLCNWPWTLHYIEEWDPADHAPLMGFDGFLILKRMTIDIKPTAQDTMEVTMWPYLQELEVEEYFYIVLHWVVFLLVCPVRTNQQSVSELFVCWTFFFCGECIVR